MGNHGVVANLLTFVRCEHGILQVVTPEGWISMAEWNSNDPKFSSFRLKSVNKSEQLLLLRDYFYQTFYTTGSSDLNPVSDKQSSFETPHETFPYDRPVRVNEAILKKVLDNGEVMVEKDTRRFVLQPGDYVRNTDSEENTVTIYNHNPRTDFAYEVKGQPFWFYSDSIQSGFGFENEYVRFYFNPFPAQAAFVAHSLIQQLDRYEVPFQIKYLNADLFADRCDRVVLYVPQRQFVMTGFAIMQVYSTFKDFLRDRLPLFVKPLFYGIGFAEEPFARESFGESRCGWVASAVMQWVTHLPGGFSGSPNVSDLVDDILNEQEIESLDHIYLNAGSCYPYNFDIFNNHLCDIKPLNQSNKWLLGAVKIANFLCREAAWIAAGKCIWIGARRDGDSNTFYAPLPNDWNSGILGPALFLIAVSPYTNDPLYQYVADSALCETEFVSGKGLLVAYEYLQGIYKYQPLEASDLTAVDEELKYQKSSVDELSIDDTDFKDNKDNYLYLKSMTEESSLSRPEKFYNTLAYIQRHSTAFSTNEFGTDDFIPGMNGLSLVGFSYLRAYDPLFPAVPVANQVSNRISNRVGNMECELLP